MTKIIFLILALFIPSAVFAQNALTSTAATTAQTVVKPDNSIQETSESRLAMRTALIVTVARNLKFSVPQAAVSLIPSNVSDAGEITRILHKSVADNPDLIKQPNICDPNYVGEPMSFSNTIDLTLDDLLLQIHNRFNVGFLIGPGVGKSVVNIKADNVPWNKLLNSQLFLLGVRASCIGNNTIQLVKNSSLPSLQNTAEVKTKFIKLKFLQPSGGGNVDIAGRSSNQGSGNQSGCQQNGGGGSQSYSQGGDSGGNSGNSGNCGNFEKLIFEIEKILGIRSANSSNNGGGGNSGANTEAVRTNRSVSQIPGRNILVVRATEEELDLINQIIERADRPPFQVVIKGLVYTANENRLRDIGVQTTIVARSGGGRTLSSIFGAPISGAGTLFDFSTLIGTVDFNVQASALEQNGVISIKSRPFATVLDGDPTALEVGRQIPILTQGSVVGGEAGNIVFINAGNKLNVTPHVIDDDNGNPVAVNLDLQITSNEVDTAVISQGLPAVNNRSIQSQIILNQEKTAILGGFTVDSINNNTSKTPGLGDIPVVGNLFKRKIKSSQINRLYFAISVSVIPYGEAIEPVVVPGATTDVPSITPEMEKRAKDPPSVVPQTTTGTPSTKKNN